MLLDIILSLLHSPPYTITFSIPATKLKRMKKNLQLIFSVTESFDYKWHYWLMSLNSSLIKYYIYAIIATCIQYWKSVRTITHLTRYSTYKQTLYFILYSTPSILVTLRALKTPISKVFAMTSFLEEKVIASLFFLNILSCLWN